MALATVSDYVAAVRVLLQDETAPFRYSDSSIVLALNMAMFDVQRLRPDLFMNLTAVPSFTVVDSTAVSMDEAYRNAVVYLTSGFVQLRDEEATQDARAGAFLAGGRSQLIGLG